MLIKKLYGIIISQIKKLLYRHEAFRPGHYYSAIPAQKEIISHFDQKNILPASNENIAGIEINSTNQYSLLIDYSKYYHELPFPELSTPDFRYYYKNNYYSYADAIFLYSFLRKHQPKKIIEVGSGFSSAVILDTVQRYSLHRPEITFIEPYPNRLKSLLRNDDKNHAVLIEKKIQDAPLSIFSTLGPGDLLFIDSSHVLKCGNDLQLLMFEILPILSKGVFVHFHDIFYPFEYPIEWLKKGIYWNEAYFLRAFLSYNHTWKIYFFNTYVALKFKDFIQTNMPLCCKNGGGSLYIQKIIDGVKSLQQTTSHNK